MTTIANVAYIKFDHVIKRSERKAGNIPGNVVLSTDVTLRLTCYYRSVATTTADYTLVEPPIVKKAEMKMTIRTTIETSIELTDSSESSKAFNSHF